LAGAFFSELAIIEGRIPMVPKKILFLFIGALFAMAAALGMALVWLSGSKSYAAYAATGSQVPKVSIFMTSGDPRTPWVSLRSLFDSEGGAIPGASGSIQYTAANPSQVSIILDVRQKGITFLDPSTPSFDGITEAQMLICRPGGDSGLSIKNAVRFTKGDDGILKEASLPIKLSPTLTLAADAALCPSKTSSIRLYLPPETKALATFTFFPLEGSKIDPSLLDAVIALNQQQESSALPLKLSAAVLEPNSTNRTHEQ
jgi:hypothetical protein